MVVSLDEDPPADLLEGLAETDGVVSQPRFIRLD
jgi:hypothetical protein